MVSEQFSGGTVFLGGNCPRGNLPRGQFSSGAIILVGNCRWGNHPGAIFPGGNCPDTFKAGNYDQ